MELIRRLSDLQTGKGWYFTLPLVDKNNRPLNYQGLTANQVTAEFLFVKTDGSYVKYEYNDVGAGVGNFHSFEEIGNPSIGTVYHISIINDTIAEDNTYLNGYCIAVFKDLTGNADPQRFYIRIAESYDEVKANLTKIEGNSVSDNSAVLKLKGLELLSDDATIPLQIGYTGEGGNNYAVKVTGTDKGIYVKSINEALWLEADEGVFKIKQIPTTGVPAISIDADIDAISIVSARGKVLNASANTQYGIFINTGVQLNKGLEINAPNGMPALFISQSQDFIPAVAIQQVSTNGGTALYLQSSEGKSLEVDGQVFMSKMPDGQPLFMMVNADAPAFYVDSAESNAVYMHSINGDAVNIRSENKTALKTEGHSDYNDIKAKELSNISSQIANFLTENKVDDVSIAKILEYLMAMANGRFKINEPSTGQITFYKRDNVTPLFVVTVTDNERNLTNG